MKKLLTEIGEFFGLNPRLWLDWTTCNASEWIVPFAWHGSSIVFMLYFAFSVGLFMISGHIEKWIKQGAFFKNLALVFVFCGFIHLVHSHSKYIPSFLILLIFSYPVLVALMINQLVLTPKLISVFKTLKTPKQVDELTKELTNQLREVNQKI